VSDSCLVVTYHYVRVTEDTIFPTLKALAPNDFERQLDVLGKAHNFIDCAELEAAILEDGKLPQRAVLLTFDDGFRDHADVVYPILRRRGIPAVFFIAGDTLESEPRLLNVHKTHFLLAELGAEGFVSQVNDGLQDLRVTTELDSLPPAEIYRYDTADHLRIKHLLNYELPTLQTDRLLAGLFAEHLGEEVAFARSLYLQRQDVRCMSEGGMTFGFHTKRHPVLARLTVAEQHLELDGGVDFIRAVSGQISVPFCFPYGSVHTYTDETLATLERCGYSMAFTTARRWMMPARDNRFEIPRFDTRDLPPFQEMIPNA
jgi:peptidoglycan/xylan/chitin deacetylase (PgdA/CDA1 family)